MDEPTQLETAGTALLAATPAVSQEAEPEAEGIFLKIGKGPWIRMEGLAYTPMEGIFIIAGGDEESGSLSLSWTGGQGRFPWRLDREGDQDIAFSYYPPSLDWVFTGLVPDSTQTFTDTRGALVVTEFGQETDELVSGTFFLYPATRLRVADEKATGSSPIEGRFRVRRAN
ncbi:hypothetical protein [Cesiribacter andamanensis]|uniref:hypothetical protein n=1 Tax=Cesiribacter andamanensis TaxID=649507 RepID=UPI0012689706|nr:hypothetical protein [Cesiribacter andamanensis]